MKRANFLLLCAVFLLVARDYPVVEAETLEQLIAGAREEGEFVFVAAAGTFGGRNGLAELERAFNAKYGLRAKLKFAAGPSSSRMAARIIGELKVGAKSSDDFFLGSQSHMALMHKERAFKKVDWSKIFPWTEEMEVIRGETVLVYTSPNGILYNSALIAKDAAPKNYADLVAPTLSATWAGKMALHPSAFWLVELSRIWGEEKVRDFIPKLVGLSGGQLRPSEAPERVVSGEFLVMSNVGGALEYMWEWQAKGAPLAAVLGLTRPLVSYFQLGVPKNSGSPNLATLFVAFMASPEAQALLNKHDFHSTHLAKGTRMNQFVRESKIELPQPKDDQAAWIREEEKLLKLLKEFTKLLRK